MYADAVRWLAGSIPVDDWDEITHLHVRQFLADLAEMGYAPAYRNNIGRCLQAYCKWLEAEEGVPNPFGPAQGAAQRAGSPPSAVTRRR